ncbi:MAG: hypothetical protein WAZ98_06290, partial [Cyclobacteriaceae bacterium]
MSRLILFGYLVLAVACSSPSIVATKTIQRGDEANNKNQYNEAIGYYEAYLKLSPQLGLYRNMRMEADVRRKLAHAYATQGKYRQSITHLKAAINIDSASKNELDFIEDYRLMGVVLGYSGDLINSRKNLQQSLDMIDGLEKSVKDSKRNSAADTYLALAQLEMTLGNFRPAEELARRANDLYSKITDGTVGVIEATLLLGIVARETGRLDEALRLINQSQELSRQRNLSIGRQAQAASEVYFLRGDSENAIRNKILALEEAERINIKPQIIFACMRLGDGYQRLGDPDKANIYYRKALSIQLEIESDTLGSAASFNMRLGNLQKAYDYYLQSGSHTGVALVGLRLGEQYFQRQELDSAGAIVEQSKNIFIKTGSREGEAKSNIELAKILIRKNQRSTARQLLNEAAKLTAQADLKWQIFLLDGIIHELSGVYDSAFIHYQRSIGIINEMRANLSTEEFRTMFVNTKTEAFDRMIVLLAKQYKFLKGYTLEEAVAESFQYNEQSRARSFLDMLGNRKIDAKSTTDQQLLDEEQLLKLKIQQLSNELNKAGQASTMVQQLSSELIKAQENYDLLMDKIKLRDASYSLMTNVEPASVEAIQNSLNEQTVLVEYWISNSTLIIWVISKKNKRLELVTISRKELNREVMIARKGISMQSSDLTE